jgi:hypothetical protein
MFRLFLQRQLASINQSCLYGDGGIKWKSGTKPSLIRDFALIGNADVVRSDSHKISNMIDDLSVCIWDIPIDTKATEKQQQW